VILAKVRSEWPGSGGRGRRRYLSFGARGRCCVRPAMVDGELYSIFRGPNTHEVELRARLTYAPVGRIKFQHENIFAELLLGWWVSNESTNHS
jgi:hypothetical protein